MTEADLQKLQALCERATPGPWRWEPGNGTPLTLYGASPNAVLWTAGMPGLPNAEFIACARTAIPALLALISSMKAREKAGEAVIEAARALKQSYGSGDWHDRGGTRKLMENLRAALATKDSKP